jgi:hypothetical protein
MYHRSTTGREQQRIFEDLSAYAFAADAEASAEFPE